MRYVISDIHGEYDLFIKLMKKINFSYNDELYVCGDILDKGPEPIKLARLILAMPNAHVIKGNHEHSFIEFYNQTMINCEGDYNGVLDKLKDYLEGDGDLLDWALVDEIERLPYYIEEDDFICIHAGLILNMDGEVPPMKTVECEDLVWNRSFKNPERLPKRSKCVFFGHSATNTVCGEDRIITYKRNNTSYGDIRDYIKIHLDTCSFVSGVLACFCIDTCREHYVKRGVD